MKIIIEDQPKKEHYDLVSTIEKYKQYKKFLVDQNSDDVLLETALVGGLEKLNQINYLFRKALQLQFCLFHTLMIQATKDENPEWEYEKDNKLILPKELFKSDQEFVFVISGKTNKELTHELIIYVESIYYFAFTINRIFDRIVGLKQFSPAGIRNVRNHIMEHAKVNNNNIHYSAKFCVSVTKGTILRTEKYVYSEELHKFTLEKTEIDKGLENNIKEFKQDLDNILTLRLSGK